MVGIVSIWQSSSFTSSSLSCSLSSWGYSLHRQTQKSRISTSWRNCWADETETHWDGGWIIINDYINWMDVLKGGVVDHKARIALIMKIEEAIGQEKLLAADVDKKKKAEEEAKVSFILILVNCTHENRDVSLSILACSRGGSCSCSHCSSCEGGRRSGWEGADHRCGCTCCKGCCWCTHCYSRKDFILNI